MTSSSSGSSSSFGDVLREELERAAEIGLERADRPRSARDERFDLTMKRSCPHATIGRAHRQPFPWFDLPPGPARPEGRARRRRQPKCGRQSASSTVGARDFVDERRRLDQRFIVEADGRYHRRAQAATGAAPGIALPRRRGDLFPSASRARPAAKTDRKCSASAGPATRLRSDRRGRCRRTRRIAPLDRRRVERPCRPSPATKVCSSIHRRTLAAMSAISIGRIVVCRLCAGQRSEHVAHRRATAAQRASTGIGSPSSAVVVRVEKSARHRNCDGAPAPRVSSGASDAAASLRRRAEGLALRAVASSARHRIAVTSSVIRSSPPR